MVIIDNEETKKYVFNPFEANILDAGHWVDTGVDEFSDVMPDELSIIYEEDAAMNSLTLSNSIIIEAIINKGRFSKEV